MKIALDFDKTFTLAPKLWVKFIKMVEKAGHTIKIVTARDQVNDGIEWGSVGLEEAPCDVIWCDGVSKRVVTAEAGFLPDIWIDDYPEGISGVTQMGTPADLELWRRSDKHRDSAIEPHGVSRGFEYKEKVLRNA